LNQQGAKTNGRQKEVVKGKETRGGKRGKMVHIF